MIIAYLVPNNSGVISDNHSSVHGSRKLTMSNGSFKDLGIRHLCRPEEMLAVLHKK